MRKFIDLTRYFIVQSRSYMQDEPVTPLGYVRAYIAFMRLSWHD